MKLKASIFIPTKNAGKGFYRTLNQISKQKEKDFEVIIVDSGSKDNTLNITEDFQRNLDLKIYKIFPEEFGHGKTRNLSLKYAKGEFIVFLTQDTIPYNDEWLSSLLENFKDEKVAGVFSKQIPNKNARENEKFFYNFYFPNKKIIVNSDRLSLLNTMFFSNQSQSFGKSILIKYPFNESLIMCEDQEWAKKIVEKGYQKVYEPRSNVIHSHNYSLMKTFQRYFDSSYSFNQILGKKDFIKYRDKAGPYLIEELKYIYKNNPLLLPRIVIIDFIKMLATDLGKNHQIIPLSLKKRFSMHKYYW